MKHYAKGMDKGINSKDEIYLYMEKYYRKLIKGKTIKYYRTLISGLQSRMIELGLLTFIKSGNVSYYQVTDFGKKQLGVEK